MENLSVFIVLLLASVVCSLPLEKPENNAEVHTQHNKHKRFINPMFSLGAAENNGLLKIRTKRQENRENEDECEKLKLCMLHRRANRNFFSAFELYFVNKENARLWDHHTHSRAVCEEKYGDCYRK